MGRFAARRLNQPTVLGELIMGIVLGNVAYFLGAEGIMVLREGPAIFDIMNLALEGKPLEAAAIDQFGAENAQLILDILTGPHGGELVQVSHAVNVFSRYGVIFLLFMVGLDTSIEEMRTVGSDSIRVAVIGVALPFVLGIGVVLLIMPNASVNTAIFIAATLGATSIGISMRVLKDLNWEHSREGHVILGAAVADDVLGLLMLAVVSGIIVSGGVELGNIASIIVLATLFLASSLYFGPHVVRLSAQLMQHLDVVEAKMFISYLFVMVLAWIANLVGLATIVGAFTAGLILNDGFFKHYNGNEERVITIRQLIMPLEVIMVPIFFVLMGIQVKLEAFLSWPVIVVACGLLAAAIIGKIACGLGVSKGTNRLVVGFGMLPRGEVGLVFAAIGRSLGVIDDALFSATVLMVIGTTLLAPILLRMAVRGAVK